MDNQIQAYDEFAIKHNAAFAAFKSIYEAKNPLPILFHVDSSDWYIALGVTIIVIASIIVSGSRTVVEFGGGLIGVSAFVMLECAVVAYAFIRTKNNVNEERIQDVRKLTNRGLWLAFTVAVAANVHATLKQNGVISSEWVNIVILLLVGVSAPTLAFISGDIAGLEYMRAVQKRRRVDEQNALLMNDWREGLNKAWSSQQSRWGVRIDVEKPKELPTQTALNDVNLRKFTSIDRPSPKLKQAIEWLREHPEHIHTESRKLGELIGVSHATANKAQHVILTENDNEG